MASEDDVNLCLAKQRQDVARVQDLVSLSAGTWDWHQVVVAGEHT